MTRKSVASRDSELLDRIARLEQRISRLEREAEIDEPGEQATVSPGVVDRHQEEVREEEFELQVGQNWFAKAGIVLLCLGFMFLLAFPYQDVPSVVPSIVGFALVAALMGLSSYWKRSFEQVAGYLAGGGMVVLFFSVLRLTFFTADPALETAELALLLLLLVVGWNMHLAIRRGSTPQIAMNLALGFSASGVTTQPAFVFGVITLGVILAVVLFRRFGKALFLFVGSAMAFAAHMLWGIGNPVIGNELAVALAPEVHFLFLVLYGCILGSAGLVGKKQQAWEDVELVFSLFLSGLFYGTFLFLSLAPPTESTFVWHLLASAGLMGLAVAYWVKEQSRYATFIFAMTGYMALSIAIVSRFTIQESFVWLCWQSVIVLSTAVWFHSRFIVVANFFIYLLIFLAYLISDVALTAVSVSFGVVALLSARILNWQRDRLELKTEMMRNAYLACALVFLPYALYHIMPTEYVSLSWLGLAFFYYLSSKLLTARKYRWMALLTMVLAIIHVFLVDLVGVDPALRIISFVVLGIALLGVSMFYTRGRKGRGTANLGNVEESVNR